MNYIYDNERPIKLAHYILEHHTTIRATAKQFNIPKSTVHHDLSFKLKYLDFPLYNKVKKLMDENFSVKHLHGGESTKHHYAQLKQEVNKFDNIDCNSI